MNKRILAGAKDGSHATTEDSFLENNWTCASTDGTWDRLQGAEPDMTLLSHSTIQQVYRKKSIAKTSKHSPKFLIVSQQSTTRLDHRSQHSTRASTSSAHSTSSTPPMCPTLPAWPSLPSVGAHGANSRCASPTASATVISAPALSLPACPPQVLTLCHAHHR